MANHKRVSEKVARPTRTTIQAALAAILVNFWHEHIDKLSRDEVATYTVVALAAVNFVWVAVEDWLGRAVLRSVPPKTVPVTD